MGVEVAPGRKVGGNFFVVRLGVRDRSCARVRIERREFASGRGFDVRRGTYRGEESF